MPMRPKCVFTDVCYASVLDKVPENVRVGMEVESVYEDY